jgi:hypothetical protein
MENSIAQRISAKFLDFFHFKSANKTQMVISVWFAIFSICELAEEKINKLQLLIFLYL